MKNWLLLALVLSAAILGACRSPSKPLTMAIIPAEEAALSREQFGPLIDYLGKELGSEVKLLIVSDYTAVVEALKYGHTDIARIGPSGYALATKEADIEAIAVAIKKKTGKPSYHSLIVVRADRDIVDLNGKSFAYVDVGSTSGYLVPATYIAREEIELGEVFFAGSHSATIEAVKNGTVDAGAIADNRYYIALEEGVIGEGEFVIFWQSDPIFNAPVVVRKSMDAELKERVRSAFLAAPREIVEQTGIGEIGYVEVKDSDYDAIREIQEVLGITD